VPSDDDASVYDPQQEELTTPPKEVLEAGAAFMSGIIHPTSATPATWTFATRGLDPELVKAGEGPLTAKGLRRMSTIAIFRRAIEMPERLPAWPEESGGATRLVAIMRRLLEADRDRDDAVLSELIQPEISRQKNGIVDACRRVVELVFRAR
jgi:hypothetical protein